MSLSCCAWHKPASFFYRVVILIAAKMEELMLVLQKRRLIYDEMKKAVQLTSVRFWSTSFNSFIIAAIKITTL